MKVKFKKLSEGEYFSALGEIYQAKKGIFETANKRLIEFLDKNPFFKRVKGKEDADTKEK